MMKNYYFLCLLFLLFYSCTTTKYVPVIEHRTDTVRQNRTTHDSVWVHDSVLVKDIGDTVWVERWHAKYQNHTVHDTTYISKTDSVPTPYPVTEYVERELTWWQQTRMHAGELLMVMMVASLLWMLVGRRR